MSPKPEVIKANPFDPDAVELESKSELPIPSTAQEVDPVYGMNLQDLELLDPRQVKHPNPPPCVLKKLEQRGLVWRWLSDVSIKWNGMRNYTAYSPDAEDRKFIDAGRAEPGLFVNAENQLRWGQDMRLGVIPRRLHELKQAAKQQRKIQQTRVATKQEAFKAEAERLGVRQTKVDYKEWRSSDLDSEDNQ